MEKSDISLIGTDDEKSKNKMVNIQTLNQETLEQGRDESSETLRSDMSLKRKHNQSDDEKGKNKKIKSVESIRRKCLLHEDAEARKHPSITKLLASSECDHLINNDNQANSPLELCILLCLLKVVLSFAGSVIATRGKENRSRQGIRELQGFNLKKIKLSKSRYEETSRKLVTHEPDSASSVNIEVVELIHNFQ
ncbi:hypothetical protein AgCh_007187 [Apium graveolens]